MYKTISNEIYKSNILKKLLYLFFQNSFIYSLNKNFEKSFANQIFTFKVLTKNPDIVTSMLVLNLNFHTKMKNLIKHFAEIKPIYPYYLTENELNWMLILFDILRIVADNIIEERSCYLSGWKNNTEIPKSFKQIFDLAEKFIQFHSQYVVEFK